IVEEAQSSPVAVEEITASFFSLLENIFRAEGLASTLMEQQRYNQPHKAFTFRMHGFESVVGPVKGVFDKEMSLNKAREHTLLRSDRPPYVTILSLGCNSMSPVPTTPTPNTPGTPKSPLPLSGTTPTKTGVPDTTKTSPGSVKLKLTFVQYFSFVFMQFEMCIFFFVSQCSPCLSSIPASVGNNPAHESGLSTCLTAGNFPASCSDSESPGGGLPPAGAGCFHSAWPGSISGRSAGHTDASDFSPDPDACVSGG
ncbi:hypothetical protein XENOCAPTIV_000650, partial [Xenoophorus captivus]